MSWPSTLIKASLSGRVRDGAGKEVLKKQLAGLTDRLPEFLDLKTGKLAAKKAPKKEKTPEQLILADVKKMEKKLPVRIFAGTISGWFPQRKRLILFTFAICILGGSSLRLICPILSGRSGT